MLQWIKIRNLAVVEEVEAEFGSGLNVLTGETGAGKSVIMGALDLVLGARADASLVREGAKEAEVEACFASREEGTGNGERGIGDGELVVVRRTVTREGKSRAWIDEESVTIAELRERTSAFVDIHGPRANQRLLEESFQRETVDGTGNEELRIKNEKLRKEYSLKFKELSDLNSSLLTLTSSLSSEDELDMLRFQVAELEEAGIGPDDEDLAERHAAAAHAEDIVEAANVITEALGGDDGAERAIAKARQGIAVAAKHFPAASEWSERIEEIATEVEELSRSVADAASKVEIDDDEFQRIDARLGVVNRMKRKYGDPIAALEKKRVRLDMLEHREEKIEELRGRIAAVTKDVKSVGAELTKLRRSAGAKLAKTVIRELRELGFAKAEFEVAFEPVEPTAHGCDRVVFMFGPNPGEPMRPLSAIASSGEIARVMLALKVAGELGMGNRELGTGNRTTLVFDEIDANIGGETGTVVGRKMREAAEGGQVIAITHLPQSAVWGDRHLVVAKKVEGGRTRTGIFPVDGDERIGEIARMLGGEKITTVVKKHAKELLELSR